MIKARAKVGNQPGSNPENNPALSMADYSQTLLMVACRKQNLLVSLVNIVTEAGFGADSAEKFFYIKCRKAGLKLDVVVLVVTIRALKMNGGINVLSGAENVEGLKKGSVNLLRHIENIKSFGMPVVVAINHFVTDTDAEVQAIKDVAASVGVEAIMCTHWANGSTVQKS